MTADQFGDARPGSPKDRTDSDGFIRDRARLYPRVRPCLVPVPHCLCKQSAPSPSLFDDLGRVCRVKAKPTDAGPDLGHDLP